MTELGVITGEGFKITTKCMLGIATTEEETAAFAALEDDCDSIEAPSNPYKLQTENLGKFFWFTGPPGTGKSTTAQMLARNHGYVYYEADNFAGMKNPYVPVDVENPSMAQFNQKKLKGEGLEERKKCLIRLGNIHCFSFLKIPVWSTNPRSIPVAQGNLSSIRVALVNPRFVLHL